MIIKTQHNGSHSLGITFPNYSITSLFLVQLCPRVTLRPRGLVCWFSPSSSSGTTVWIKLCCSCTRVQKKSRVISQRKQVSASHIIPLPHFFHSSKTHSVVQHEIQLKITVMNHRCATVRDATKFSLTPEPYVTP